MTITKILFITTTICFLTSCKPEDKDKSLQIYHLKPNSIQINTDTLKSYGWYTKTRNDFFTIKNFDDKNEQHKIKVDSFVVNYIKKDSFLVKNKNAKWSLTFFRYGDGIDKNTVHQYNTDYTIHNLFAQKKEIAGYAFDSQVGYRESYYWINQKEFKSDDKKREIIVDYFKNNSQ